MKSLVLIPAILMLMTFACPPPQPLEQSARDAVATAKGYLTEAKTHHPECATDASSVNCQIIAKGVASKDTVIDALNIYCASDAYSNNQGNCVPDKSLQPKLQAALSDLNQTMGDVKKIAGK